MNQRKQLKLQATDFGQYLLEDVVGVPMTQLFIHVNLLK